MASWVIAVFVCVVFSGSFANAQLTSSFYNTTCPNLIPIVRNAVRQAVNNEGRIAASILRLHFHDCFVNGCDGSILLDNGGEKTAPPNTNGSARRFNVVDNVKTAVENSCKGVVSCSDILALMAKEAVSALQGPQWTVVFGRRDSTAGGNTSPIPPPTLTASALITNFQNQGLSTQDMVALSGAHTIGQARCTTFRARLYNTSSTTSDPNIDAGFKRNLQSNCPSTGMDNKLSPLDLQTPLKFDNNYFKNLQGKKGVLFSDQDLFSSGGTTQTLVTKYAGSQSSFFTDFASAMVSMGNINPLTSSSGEIRKICSKKN